LRWIYLETSFKSDQKFIILFKEIKKRIRLKKYLYEVKMVKKLSYEEFVRQAILKLREGNYKGIHSV